MIRLVLGCALLVVACGRDAQVGGADADSNYDARPGIDSSGDDASRSDGGTENDAGLDAGVDAPADAAIDAMPDAPPADETPPALISVSPAKGSQGWLADTIRFTFDEPIIVAGATVSAKLAGAAVDATLALEGDRTIAVRIDPAARGVGVLAVTLAGTIRDEAGNAAVVPCETDLVIPAWHRPALDRGAASGSPAVAVADDGTTFAAWIVGAAGSRRVVVSRYDRGAWQALGAELGADDAASPTLAFDAAERLLVGWVDSNTAKVARWTGGTWSELASPGAGSKIVLARALSGGAPAALVAASALQVTTLGANDAWTPLGDDLAITGSLVGDPALAVPVVGKAVAAWIDSQNNVARLRAAKNVDGTWVPFSPILLGSPPSPNAVSLAARGDAVAIAWDQFGGSFGVYAAKAALGAAGWTRLGRVMDVDAAGDARAPAIALDAGGAPIVAWTELVETAQRGVLARWSGTDWTIVGGQSFLGSAGGSPSRATLALRDGEAPVVGFGLAGDVTVARFNGPRTAGPGMARRPLTGCSFDAASPPARLLQTGCFTLPSAGKPVPHGGLVPFDVVSELWSDNTRKRRWVALPANTTMTTSATGAWVLPVGGFTVKEFAIETTPGNPATRKPVETRFFVRTAEGYRGFSYQWRTDGSDADLLNDGTFYKDWQTSAGTYKHVYPSRSQCTSCHEGSWGPMLGLRPQQLARWYDYNGTIADQLATLVAIDVGPAGTATPWFAPHDASLSYEQRTRGYMASNCAHCHNPNHIAIKDLRPTTPLAQTRLCEVIVPGKPEESIVYARVTQRPGMPPLGTLIPDPLAKDLLGTWITGMQSCP